MKKKIYNFAVYSENIDYFYMNLTLEEYQTIEMFLEELNNSSRDVAVRLYDSSDII